MYSKLNPQPANLADNEVAFDVDGTLVAVSVHPTWLVTNGGVSFLGTARHIEADGTSCQCGNGREIKTVLHHTANLAEVQLHGQDAIAREVILALLGQPLTTETVDGEERPLIPWDEAALQNWNIKVAAQVASAAGPTSINPADLLGL